MRSAFPHRKDAFPSNIKKKISESNFIYRLGPGSDPDILHFATLFQPAATDSYIIDIIANNIITKKHVAISNMSEKGAFPEANHFIK
jgi:hypothetical protein